jgi:MFS superfamily sulfate permease-like transporter
MGEVASGWVAEEETAPGKVEAATEAMVMVAERARVATDLVAGVILAVLMAGAVMVVEMVEPKEAARGDAREAAKVVVNPISPWAEARTSENSLR